MTRAGGADRPVRPTGAVISGSMPRIARATLQRLATYGSFFLHDPAVSAEDPDDATAVAASREAVIAATEHRAYVQTAQRAVAVHIALEVWDEQPPDPGTERWDERHEVPLTCPTGRLMVENTGDGPVELEPYGTREINLAPGAVHVTLRLYAGGLDTAEEVDRIYQEQLTAPFDELRAHLRALDGREQYLIQAWPTASTAGSPQHDIT